MSDEIKPVEATEVAGTSEGVENQPAIAPKQEIDYAKQLEIERAKTAKAELEKENYKRAALIAKGKIKPEDDETEKTVGDLVKEEIQKGLAPVIQSMTGNTVENIIRSVSSNPSEQALIKHIYDNKIVHSGYDTESIKQDLEDAKALANKQKFVNAANEVRIASQNTNNSPSQTTGSHTEGNGEVKDHFFGKEQEADLRRKFQTLKDMGVAGFDKITPEQFIANAKENMKRN